MARAPFQILKAVVFALFIRELKTRFGEYRLGYVWALVEPAAHVLMFSLIWHALGRTEFSGIPVTLFLFTGMIPLLFFTQTATKCMSVVRQNRGLFNYRQVRPVDPVIARVMLETLIVFFVYMLLMGGAGWFFDYEVWPPNNILGLILINLLLVAFTFSVSLILSVYGALYPEAMKLFPTVVFRVMYFTSGVLFPLSQLPQEYQEWLLWNPMMHVIELNHVYYFSSFSSPDVSPFFVLLFTIACLTFGLLGYRANWTRMIVVTT